MKKQKFKKGDIVTFKSHSELNRRYVYGGDDYGGTRCAISDYYNFNDERDCWKIEVVFTKLNGYNASYTMLESEFKEWDVIDNQLPLLNKKLNVNFSY
jgi:hypothetical protein